MVCSCLKDNEVIFLLFSSIWLLRCVLCGRSWSMFMVSVDFLDLDLLVMLRVFFVGRVSEMLCIVVILFWLEWLEVWYVMEMLLKIRLGILVVF